MLLQTKVINDILKNRGITLKDLEPIDSVPEYELINMSEAANRFIKLVMKNKIVGILYDTDCDGICAGRIAENYIKKTGLVIKRYMNKDKSHGLNENIIKEIEKDGIELLIIVDAGSKDTEYLKYLEETGLDIIVLDHHDIAKEELICSNGIVIVNCAYEDSPNKDLSGAGVVYKFVREVNKKLQLCNVRRYETWVGMSVLSDARNILNKENRYYVEYAYKHYQDECFLNAFKNFGSINNLLNYTIIPLINACARMGYTELIMDLANAETNYNLEGLIIKAKDVKILQDELVIEAEKELKSQQGSKTFLGVFTDIDHKKISGLLANKMLNKLGKSVIVIGKSTDGVYTGSFRGMGKITSIILKDMGIDARGHDYASGIYMPADIVKKQMAQFLNYSYDGEDKIEYDLEIDMKDYSKYMQDMHRIAILNEKSGRGFPNILVKINNVPENIEMCEFEKVRRYKNMNFDMVDFDMDAEPFVGGDLIVQPTLYNESFTLVKVRDKGN